MEDLLKDIDANHKARMAMVAILRHYRNPRVPVNLERCKEWAAAVMKLTETRPRIQTLKPEKVRIREFI